MLGFTLDRLFLETVRWVQYEHSHSGFRQVLQDLLFVAPVWEEQQLFGKINMYPRPRLGCLLVDFNFLGFYRLYNVGAKRSTLRKVPEDN